MTQLPKVSMPKPYKKRPLTLRGLMKQKVALKFSGPRASTSIPKFKKLPTLAKG